MSPSFLSISIFIVCLASVSLADDFKTIYGNEYKNAQVTGVEPDGIMIKTKSDLTKIYFNELSKEVQERFHYDAQRGAQYTAEAYEQIRITQQQKIEQDQKRADEIARNLAIVRQQQEAEAQHQHEGEMQRQRLEAQQQRQVRIQPTYSRSQEGIPEHTYELTQDYKMVYADGAIRFRRGERFRGRILVDHAEIDRGGVSLNVPSGTLRKVD